MADKKSSTHFIPKLIFMVLLQTAFLFLTAGTLRWPEAWVYLGLFLVYGMAIGTWMKKHDPELFRLYCRQLLSEAQALRRAARSRDARGCQRAIDACDPALDKLSRTFPLTQKTHIPRKNHAGDDSHKNRIP